MRRAIGATLLLLGATAVWAGPTPRYARIVALYESGDRAAAVSEIGEVSDDDLRRELKELRKTLGPGAPPCRPCEREISLHAALMLHTDRALLERQPQAAGEPQCVTSFHADVAAAIAEIVAYRDGGLGSYAGRWAVATAIRARADGCMLDAVHFADLGLRWYPRDPTLRLLRGVVHETLASALAGQGWIRLDGRGPELRYEEELGFAAAAFEGALAVDPDLAEARLRLGRVQWRMGNATQARASLQAVLEAKPNRSLAYLAHLFLGRLDEDAGRFDRAREEYEAALGLDPGAQAASVALSHTLLMGGDEAAARRTLKIALASGWRLDSDLYWGYPQGGSDAADAIFESLRREPPERERRSSHSWRWRPRRPPWGKPEPRRRLRSSARASRASMSTRS